MKPEELTKHNLTQWLLQSGCEVFWEKKNAWNYPTFKTSISRKPDLLIFSNNNYHWPDTIIAVEVKTSDKDKNLLEGTKIIDYYDDFVHGNIQYKVDDNEVNPTIFAIASDLSPFGKLLKNDTIFRLTKDMNPDGFEFKLRTQNTHLLPRTEYNRTKDFWRHLIQQWGLKGKNPKAGLGILLSSSIDTIPPEEKMGYPKIQCQTYRRSRNIEKKKWQSGWMLV